MAIIHDFSYFCPIKLDEVHALLDKYGDKARLLAGGTDLTVYLKEDIVKPEAVIDIKRVQELSAVDWKDDGLFIGAKSTFSDILADKRIKENYLLLWESAHSVASVGIRNRATLVGNISTAVPSLDSAPALLCYEAVVHVSSSEGMRQIPINEWFKSPRKTALRPNEIVLGVFIPNTTSRNAGCYLKLGRYGGEDLAQAGLGIFVNEKYDYRLAFCAVGPVPLRATYIEELIQGRELTPELIASAKELVESEVMPITDIRSSREYRIHMCQVMLERGLMAATDRLRGKTVDTTRILGG